MIGWESGASSLHQSQSAVNQDQRRIALDTQLKIVLINPVQIKMTIKKSLNQMWK